MINIGQIKRLFWSQLHRDKTFVVPCKTSASEGSTELGRHAPSSHPTPEDRHRARQPSYAHRARTSWQHDCHVSSTLVKPVCEGLAKSMCLSVWVVPWTSKWKCHQYPTAAHRWQDRDTQLEHEPHQNSPPLSSPLDGHHSWTQPDTSPNCSKADFISKKVCSHIQVPWNMSPECHWHLRPCQGGARDADEGTSHSVPQE